MEKMKATALYYMDYAAAYPGNFIASMRRLFSSLKERGVSTHCVFPERAKGRRWIQTLEEEGIGISYKPAGVGEQFKLLKKIFKENKIIFVHIHFTDDIRDRIVIKSAMLATGRKCPIVVHYHNHYAASSSFVKKFIKRLVIHGDYLVGCGSGVAASLRSGKMKNDITFVENAIDFARLESSRESYDNHDFLQFGFHYERKGVDVSLDAFDILNKKYSDLTLNISLSSNEEYVRKRIIEKYGEIPKWVRLLDPIDNIVEYYDRACAFLSPSREEGLCYAVIEAAYCRCPVIASDISGLNEIRIPDIIWCEKENPQSLADRIDTFLCMSEEKKRSLGNKLKASAEKNYKLERWEREMLTYYEERALI
ncbi:MAG: glycosyltransferase family 4 protein [Butyrivibrio sp.]|nr:glycosyltransferase family 4 protein [Butyrivibrio sp.]